MAKFKVYMDLRDEGHDVLVEAIFENGKRCDILDLCCGKIYEVLGTETVEMCEKKVKEYPPFFLVEMVKTKDILVTTSK